MRQHAEISIPKALQCLAVVAMLAVLTWPAASQGALIKDVEPDAESASGHVFTMVDFAHTTDVHITDEGNPIRAEELKLIWGYDPALYPDIGWLLLNLVTPAHRDIGAYTGLIWQATIKSINDAHLQQRLDFLISTGDHTDTGQQDELAWFVALADGKPLPALQTHTNRAGLSTKAPEAREALIMPWFAAVGNHDVEYQGTFNSSGVVGILVQALFFAPDRDYYINNLSYLEDVLAIENGHGFSAQSPRGYYSFDPTPYVHGIVLNTADFNPVDKLPLENLSLGMLSQAQFGWMQDEIRNNAGKLCIIFAHHGPDSFVPLVTDQNTKYVSAQKLKESLKTYANVIAFVSGHTHMNRIIAETTADGSGYWDINTCGVADWPQEWRRITVRDNGDGTGTIICRMHSYNPEIQTQETYQLWDPMAQKYLDAVYIPGTPIRDVSQAENDTSAAGVALDRDVDLTFTIPPAVKDTILANYKPATAEAGSETSAQAATKDGGDDGGSIGGCFMNTAQH
jgi:3',5'-cyclic AMP phosphodiesterase CpdA